MATIILNGVENDTNPLEGTTDLNDKLTVSGGLEGYEADMQGGSDLVEIDQAGEDVSDTTIAGGDDDDKIVVDSSSFEAVSNSATLAGGLGNDTTLIGYGEDGGVEGTEAGLVTFSGRAAGGEGEDFIGVVRADGATVQAGPDADYVELGSWSPVDVPGSRGDSTIVNTSANGGSGDDNLHILYAAKLTDSTVNGGNGYDSIYIDGSLTGTTAIGTNESGDLSADSIVKAGDEKDKIFIDSEASLVNTLINGNKGPDWIKANGELESTEGSIVSGARGHDTIDVAAAGPMTVKGGKGKDLLRVGSGQIVYGGDGKDLNGDGHPGDGNADVFSIESAGGATIMDFEGAYRNEEGFKTENCYCSDVIQVDGNKITYDTYIYKATKEKYTSASSYEGNIKVKAFEVDTYCETYAFGDGGAQKTAAIDASAYVQYKAVDFVPNARYSTVAGVATGYGDFNPVAFPATFDGRVNGNAPRPTDDVRGIGYGAAVVTGYVIDRGVTAEAVNNYRSVRFPNATAYTYTSFEKGDFSFLDEPFDGNNSCVVKQTLVFDDVTRGTITNHWVNFGVAKTTSQVSLYDMKLGTANFTKVTTGKANLVITRGLVDKTYYPTPDQITNNALVQDGYIANVNQTAGGKYVYTRTDNAYASANGELNLSTADNFTLWTKRNDGIGVVVDAEYPVDAGVTGIGSADGWIRYGGLSWTQAQNAGLLTLTVATQVTGNVQPFLFTKAMNHTSRSLAAFTTTTAYDGTPAQQIGNPLDPFRTVTNRTVFNGASGGVNDTRTATGNLVAKIRIQGSQYGTDNAYLPSWLGRAVIKGETFQPETCYFPSTLAENKVSTADIESGIHNKYTPASISTSNKGEFGTKWMWTSGGVKLNGSTGYIETSSLYTTPTYNPIKYLEFSNGCPTSSGVKEFSCSSTSGVNAYRAIFGTEFTELGVQGRAELYNNNAFFSASKFTTNVLAAEGMGDNAQDAEGAPFRVLFFDTSGDDNGLYLMAGTANYKNGDVTAINTNPTHSSAIGGKQTIVKVSGGKGHEIALNDINFV